MTLGLHRVQQPLGAERGRGEHDLVGGQHARRRTPPQLGRGAPDVHVVPAPVTGRDPGDRGQRQHGGAVLLGEVQVVLHQGVLGVVPAAGHALAAVAAGVAVGTLATEVRVGDVVGRRLAGPAEEHPDRCRPERLPHAHLLGDLAHHLVGRRVQRVRHHAEHPLRLVVVRRQLGAPVGDVAPGGVGVEGGQRLVERVRVDQRPAADAGPRQDQAVLQDVDALDAVAAGLRPEQEPLEVPRRRREVLVGEPCTRLEHADAVALLGQPQGRDRSAEARADDQDVEVRCGHGRPSFFIRRRLPVITFAYAASDMPNAGAILISRWVPTDCVSV